LTTRAVIDQAIGILIGRTGVTADEPFHRLRTSSQSEHRKLSVLATEIVQAAVRRSPLPTART
jgi:AmiR/NasT family two-component response regulator